MTIDARPWQSALILALPAVLLSGAPSGCSADSRAASGSGGGAGVFDGGEDSPAGDGDGDGDGDGGSYPDTRPNVVLILADDLGYGDLAAYGHPYSHTPRLDKLAEEGIQFRNFHVTGVTCSPSRTGFMTSRHSASYANYPADWGFQDRETISRLLHNAGYATGHFGKWHIGGENEAVSGVYGLDDVQVIGGDKDAPEGRDIAIFRAAAQFIERNRDRPFYVNVWAHATHYPVGPHASLAEVFSDVTCLRSDFGKYMVERFDQCEAIGGDIVKSMRSYLGDVYGLDIGVGQLLDKLDELGLRDNTLVVFSSDQGPAPIQVNSSTYGDVSEQNMLGYAGGLRGTKHTQYEGGVRVPFILRWPNKVPVHLVDSESVFSAMDWLPTIAAIAGVQIDESWYEGEDVSDIWLGNKRSRANPLFWRTSQPNAKVSMLQGRWKIHVDGANVELYDLSVDEKEENNVANQYPGVVNKLRSKIEEWKSGLPNVYADGQKLDDPVGKPHVVGPADL